MQGSVLENRMKKKTIKNIEKKVRPWDALVWPDQDVSEVSLTMDRILTSLDGNGMTNDGSIVRHDFAVVLRLMDVSSEHGQVEWREVETAIPQNLPVAYHFAHYLTIG